VDKPIAVTLEEAGKIIATANANGAWVSSFCSLRELATTAGLASQAGTIGEIRAGQFAGPVDWNSIYGGPWFYATHTIELALRLMGEGVETVSAARAGAAVSAVLGWENGSHAALTFPSDAKYAFHATLYGKDGVVTSPLIADHDGYRRTITKFLNGMLDGIRPLTDEQLLRPIAIMHALEQSLDHGGIVEIAPLIAGALAGKNNVT
jgi:predicted dehydrogenase